MATFKKIRAHDSRQKSVLGGNDVPITNSRWSKLSFWNASVVLESRVKKSSKSGSPVISELEYEAKLVGKLSMEHASREEWTKRILNGIVRNEYVNAFIDRSTNWPKIKKREYKQGITMAEMTSIIMEHRATLVTWIEKQEEMKRVQKIKPMAVPVRDVPDVEVPDVEVPDVEVPDVVISNDETPDNWEDLED
jgi:hypothetical protein